MTVAAILAQKGNSVLTVEKTGDVSLVAGILAKNKIGAVVVTNEDGTVCGIISERDIVRVLAEHGADGLSRPISSCMTSKVISCSVHDTVNEVMEKMTAGRFRHMPIIDQNKLGGIISIGDVVKRKIEQTEREAEEMRNYIAAS